MLRLKPIAEQILQEADDTPTWGEVQQAFEAMVGKKNKEEISKSLKQVAKSGSKLAANLLTGGLFTVVSDALDAIETIGDSTDVAKGMLAIGKTVAMNQMKNPKSSEFKKMTASFWDAVRIDPEVSIVLDDQIEKQFIDQIIIPNLKKGGNENEKIPNMNYELGKWLNSQGLKQADIFFKGKEGEL